MKISAGLFVKTFLRDPLILFFGGIMVLLLIFNPSTVFHFGTYIHWSTIIALSGLLIITTGIQQSGLMEDWATRLIQVTRTERELWLLLIFFSALLSSVLTNDIALFLIIPFTLHLNGQIALNIRTLLILETIAVNTGSLVTPIGNPQNIYLWQKSGISFFAFVANMLPVGIILLIVLLAGTFFLSRPTPFHARQQEEKQPIKSRLALLSSILLIGYLAADNFGYGNYFVGLLALFFFIFYRDIFLNIDWNLIILFVLLFIDMGIVSQFGLLRHLTSAWYSDQPFQIVVLGTAYSQVISNVPATLFLAHFTTHWKYLAWGVNIGGNGLLIASFANLISLRLSRRQKIGWLYHLYSIPFLILSLLLVYLWIIICHAG